jgi:ABC-type dipeptide/oligopeptide/nickel transport system ATPase component
MLEVQDLYTHFRTMDGVVKAVDGVSFSIDAGQSTGVVGESGSGRALPPVRDAADRPAGWVASGHIYFGERICHTQRRGDAEDGATKFRWCFRSR